MAQHYVASTLTCDQRYAFWARNGGEAPVLEREILIKGGANIAHPRLMTVDGIVTQRGVLTPITDDEETLLQSHPLFQAHRKNGFVQILSHKANPEKVARDMTPKDTSAPKTPDDFAEDSEVKPAEGKPSRRR